MKGEGLRMLGWIIPIVCMTIGGWVVYGQREEFEAASARRYQSQHDLEEAQKQKDLYDHLKPSSRYAAEEDVPLEETAFLNYLRTRCVSDGVRFDKYQTQSLVYGKDKQLTAADPKNEELLKGLRRISCTLTLVGQYSGIRKLLGELEASNRLYTLTNVAWSVAEHGTALTMTISRYVEPPKPQPKDAPAKPKPAAGTPAKPGTKVDLKATVAPGAPVKPGTKVELKTVVPTGTPTPIKKQHSTPSITIVNPGAPSKP